VRTDGTDEPEPEPVLTDGEGAPVLTDGVGVGVLVLTDGVGELVLTEGEGAVRTEGALVLTDGVETLGVGAETLGALTLGALTDGLEPPLLPVGLCANVSLIGSNVAAAIATVPTYFVSFPITLRSACVVSFLSIVISLLIINFLRI